MLDQGNRALLDDALEGLGRAQKALSPKWFYDKKGSDLFEKITALPEYYPTRTETQILTDNAGRLAEMMPEGGALIELGSGASVKTRRLLDAADRLKAYVPIDISEEFLLATADDLRRRYRGLAIHPVVADFTQAVRLPDVVADLPKVGFFPGSTIGNLDPAAAVALLSRARAWSGVQAFILGADLVKDRGELVAAYDDAEGVTAAFNINVLNRLNGEANATFDPSGFRHEARWCEEENRIEMHLVAKHAQTVRLGEKMIDFAAGESIHTESCRKYTPESLSRLAGESGWNVETLLTDARDRFAVAVLRPD